MTVKEIVAAYRRDGKLQRREAKELTRQLSNGELSSVDFVGLIPFPVLEQAYNRFASKYPIKYAAWTRGKAAIRGNVNAPPAGGS